MATKREKTIDRSALRFYRLEAGLTMQQFADKIGWDVGSVSNWELGKFYPNDQAIDTICEVLNIRHTDLEHNLYTKARVAHEVYIRRQLKNIEKNKAGVEGQDLDLNKPEQVQKFFESLGVTMEDEPEDLTDEEEELFKTTAKSRTDIEVFPESPQLSGE